MIRDYLLIDPHGVVINVIRWDGSTDWQPPSGCSVQLKEVDSVSIGWRLTDGQWVAPDETGDA